MFLKNKIVYNLFLLGIVLMFFSCTSRTGDRNSPSFIAFTKRTNNLFGNTYPIYTPFEPFVGFDSLSCNGFSLDFTKHSNITDTISGILELKDSNDITIDYEGYISPNIPFEPLEIPIKSKEVFFYPSPHIDSIGGTYSFIIFMADEKKPYAINLITKTHGSILLYEKGDDTNGPRGNFCFLLSPEYIEYFPPIPYHVYDSIRRSEDSIRRSEVYIYTGN
jgi:hypothetical protein